MGPTLRRSEHRAVRAALRSLAKLSKPWRDVELGYLKCVRLFILLSTVQLLTDLLLSGCVFYMFLEATTALLHYLTTITRLTGRCLYQLC